MPTTYAPRSGGLDRLTTGAEKWFDTRPLRVATKNLTAKPQERVYLHGTTVDFVVEDPEETVDVGSLDQAAREVGYFGRSQDLADLTVVVGEPETGERDTWTVTAGPARETFGWSAHSLERFDINHGRLVSGDPKPALPARPYVRPLHYTRQTIAQPLDAPHAPAVHILARRQSVHSSRISEVLSRIPAQAHGEIFPCVDAGHANSRGRMLGIGLISPMGDSAMVGGVQLDQEWGPEWNRGQWALTASRWEKSGTVWTSATPVRFFPDLDVLVHQLREDFSQVRPGVGIQVTSASRSPQLPWQHAWAQPPDGLANWWLRLTTDQRVAGPLILGSSTELGFGLFIPDAVQEGFHE